MARGEKSGRSQLLVRMKAKSGSKYRPFGIASGIATNYMANGVNYLAGFTNWRVFHTYEVEEMVGARNM